MLISILTFQGYNELDSFIALGILNRIKKSDWRVNICCPEEYVTSWNDLTVKAQSRFEDIEKSDAVIIGSGALTRDIVKNSELMAMIKLNPSKQSLIIKKQVRTIFKSKLNPSMSTW